VLPWQNGGFGEQLRRSGLLLDLLDKDKEGEVEAGDDSQQRKTQRRVAWPYRRTMVAAAEDKR
jgi:hypothetical protein